MSLASLIKKAKSNWSAELLEFFSTGKSLLKKSSDDRSADRSPEQSVGCKSQMINKNALVAKREVRGFSNLGNTCFFNSVMQNVMQTSWLKMIMDNFSTSYNVDIDAKHRLEITQLGDMTSSLAQLYSTYFNGSNHCIAPKMLFQSLCLFCPMFKSREQQDSQEMFSCLVNGLFEEDEKRLVFIASPLSSSVLLKYRNFIAQNCKFQIQISRKPSEIRKIVARKACWDFI